MVSILVISSIIVILFTCYKWLTTTKSRHPLPPGPKGLPIVGNLPFLDPQLHVCYAKLSQFYGPILKVRLGSKLCIVVSSSSVAKNVLRDHDAIFANHDVPAVGYAGTYGGVDIVWSPNGDHLRMLRKVCVKELMTGPRLEALYGLRRREVRDMVSKIYSDVEHPIEIGEIVLVTMFQLITSMLWGGTLEEQDRNRVSLEFQQVTAEMVKLLGELNVSDFFPAIAMFDLQGKVREMKKLRSWFDGIFDFVIKKKLEGMENDFEKKDFLQILLESKEKEDHKTPFSLTHIKAILLDMMVAGTKTSSTTIEWVMAELMKHPESMTRVQEELKDIVGVDNIVEESHLQKLKYLNAVVKEVLRLHPTAPLLVPRVSSESCTVGGYMIPKGATVIVNAWAIHRDPEFWDNPLEFRPERFLNFDSEYDFRGTNFSYIPFGSGRRICVGVPLAERMIPYLLASLLHSFNWKLPEETEIDLSEMFGLELKKKNPLIAIPIPRLLEPGLYA
ncbi:hypothetical protein ACHQM5_001236 [Ranunculus cassubicifolius]